jgi:hypothetical protein
LDIVISVYTSTNIVIIICCGTIAINSRQAGTVTIACGITIASNVAITIASAIGINQ